MVNTNSDKKANKKAVVFNFDKTKRFTVEEAIEIAKKSHKAKFVGSIDIAVKLNLDTKKADQQLRGTVALPHFFGKENKILVLDKNLTQKDAARLGVAYAGESDLIAEISRGWIDFDLIITTPKMMIELSKLGKILGTKGLMPNPKNGNITTELEKTIAKFKKGLNQYRTDSFGNIHMTVGKTNADSSKIKENVDFLIEFLNSKKPALVKGVYIQNISLSASMGPGVKIALDKSSVTSTKKSATNKKDTSSKEDASVVKKETKQFLQPLVKHIRKS